MFIQEGQTQSRLEGLSLYGLGTSQEDQEEVAH